MAESEFEFEVTKREFARTFEELKVSNWITHKIHNEALEVIKEVLGSLPQFSQVDLNFDFSKADQATKKLANLEKRNLRRDYARLKEKMKAKFT